jgi:NADPH:quinone reductase-like Zn-dependent oxidoreductase
MRAIVRHRYGPPEVLRLEEVPRPVPREDEVLVRIHAASANAGDWHLLRADPFFIRFVFGGILRPKLKVLGSDIAGRVEAVGSRVTRFGPGDAVFGELSDVGFGAFAEFVSVPERVLLAKPAGSTFEAAAALPIAATVALQGLRDKGRVRPGQKVLVNGASGGVGTFAVQIAKALGAEVTGVCSSRNLDLVRSIGADHVIDYTREDFTRGPKRYDLILDTAAHRSVLESRRALGPAGVYVMIGGATRRMFQVMFLGPLVSRTGRRKLEFLMMKPNPEDLMAVKGLVEAGKVSPVIDRRFTLEEVPDAIRYLEAGHTRGKVVIHVMDPVETGA